MTAAMAAIRQHSFGPPDVLRLERVARPVPGPGEVLVRVHACGVNPVDWKTRAGVGLPLRPALPPGWDVSGEVVEVGPGVTRFRPGDEVFGMPRFPDEAACYAELVTAPAGHLAAKPARLGHREAAGLGLAGLTAWQALVGIAAVGDGDRVLVNSAAGGVGHLAVQIAKARGAHVTALARPVNHPALRALGVDEVADYRAADVTAGRSGLDLVLDAFGGPGSAPFVPMLRPGGLLLPVTGAGGEELAAVAAQAGARVAGLLVRPDADGLESLADLAERGRLRVLVHARLPLAEAAAAHRLGEQGRTVGKIVLTP